MNIPVNQDIDNPSEKENKPTLTYIIDDRLYINLCNRCTLVCQFCPKTHDNWQLHEYNLALPKSPSVDSILDSIGNPNQYSEIIFCGYGEPTLRLKALIQIAKALKEMQASDSSGPTPLRINSDGLANLVYKRNILPELEGLIDSWSISLSAHNEEVYIKHCQPTLDDAYSHVKQFIQLASKNFKVTATAINGLEGVDIESCKTITESLGAEFRERFIDKLG